MTGLPKKYARMGFKKGWRAFKAAKRSYSRASTSPVVRKVARRRKKSRSRSYARRAGIGSSAKPLQIDAMLYGAVRAPVSGWIKQKFGNVLGGLPGTFGDEAVMIGLNYLVAKKAKGMVRQVAMKGLAVENALAGAQLGGMVYNKIGLSTTGATSSGDVLLG